MEWGLNRLKLKAHEVENSKEELGNHNHIKNFQKGPTPHVQKQSVHIFPFFVRTGFKC